MFSPKVLAGESGKTFFFGSMSRLRADIKAEKRKEIAPFDFPSFAEEGASKAGKKNYVFSRGPKD